MKNRLNLLLAPLAFAAIALVVTSPAHAQATPESASANPNSGFNSNERTSGQSEVFQGGLNPLQLIHNANLRRSRDGSEFSDDTQTSLSRSAEEFKRLQRQKLEEQSHTQATPTPAPKPAP
jgi:hypothetical protein